MLRQIEQDWPQDTIWGKRDTPGTYKNEVPSTEARRIVENYPVNSIYGCGGYATMVSSLVFGDTENPGRKLDDLSQIRPSDIVFLVNNDTNEIWHVMIALESPSEIHAFHYTDGNNGGHIHWPDRTNPYGREKSGLLPRREQGLPAGSVDAVSRKCPIYWEQRERMAYWYQLGEKMHLKPPIPRMNSPDKIKYIPIEKGCAVTRSPFLIPIHEKGGKLCCNLSRRK